ncbi:mixed-linked glucanase precursor [Pseudovirgaria hyperparasitica]|uniref:endo-1,3(4)-beta-glucanase n=1 Tax=Pseudovirgaria hyperparasitica TaxID=470096 RepID=A0A6A6W5R7_9PEZI|nr:mixed-linked glucanase precursor [Pseudovirgaria hyperparasitica]KAF2756401.1 mixed-linked glucanase precursor [Pseudovirgaria hyperparasitica]
MSFRSLASLLVLGATSSARAAPSPAGAPGDGLYLSQPEPVQVVHPQTFQGNGSNPRIDSAASYRLVDTYDASNWFSKFTVENIADPTHGFVNYLNQADAQRLGLYKTQNNQVYIGVDNTNVISTSGPGRNSVRIHSNPSYNHGLIIGDFAHIPGSQCGSWPAFWMLGPNWPNSGEIDIIEGVHTDSSNQMTLHSAPGCSPGVGPAGENGYRVANSDCGAGSGYNGCGVKSTQANTYGTSFNANGGGVYATLWTSSAIQVWYWAQRDVPSDVRNGNPNPASWPKPQANFYGGCNFDSYFKNLQIIFDITFCGDWAGNVWSQYTSCYNSDTSCTSYVARQPQNFRESYWLVNSVKVYA